MHLPVGDPSEKSQAILLKHYLEREVEDQDVRSTKGLSAAALREACLLVRLKNISLSEASKRLKQHKEIVRREFGAVGEIGLGGRSIHDFEDF